MGNRAVITTAPYKPGNLGVYVHWNGGRASIEGFLKACEKLEYRAPSEDTAYGFARLAGAIGVYFGGNLSLGIDLCKNLDDHPDNGYYLIDGWKIVGRGADGKDKVEEEVDQAKTDEICATIVFKTRAMEKLEYVAA